MGMSRRLSSIDGDYCSDVIRQLDGIGIRFAGTPGEAAAARWIADRFAAMVLENVQVREFPCLSFAYSDCRVEALQGGDWVRLPSLPAAHSLATASGALEGELVMVERIPARAAECRRLLEGKVGLLFCSEIFRLDRFRRVMKAAPLALLLVDDRFPNDWTVAIGFPRHWVDLISCPVVNLPHSAAWEAVRRGASRVRLDVRCRSEKSFSQNVIGEVPGREKPEEVIVVSAHHDSVINNPGADDNLSGVAAVLALARCFSGNPARRTLRFISYGAEEQLSEGARHYALEVPDRDRIQFVLNIDAVGAWMGQTDIFYTGSPELAATVEAANRDVDFPGHVRRELSPFSDHFPLNLFGIPAVWYYRRSYLTARHFHHSDRETPEVVSPGVMERTVRAQAALLERVADAVEVPFQRHIPGGQLRRLRKMGRDWCGLRLDDV